jgi:NAD(P)-dependent dehydrogenase (short-subunit alcohol dehydrogenase family)
MSSNFDFGERLVLVTGASAGIGRATAELLARLGATIVANGRDQARLDATLAALHGTGHRAAPFDLSSIDAIPAWLKQLAAERPFDGIAHCAGLQVARAVRQFDVAHFDQIMHANLASALALARGLRQQGVHAPSAAMVLVSSVGAYIGQPSNIVYGASKAGLVAVARGLAMELLRDGIRVNAVAPALVETDMAERTRRTMTEAQYAALLDRHPMGLGKPEDVANSIAFLLGDGARWINGVTLPVDGGHLAR